MAVVFGFERRPIHGIELGIDCCNVPIVERQRRRWAHLVADTCTYLIGKDRIIVVRQRDAHNARIEGLNGLFQAARAGVRGYRNTATFITMIYLIATPIEILFNSI